MNAAKENLQHLIQTAIDQCKEEITSLEFQIQHCAADKTVEALRKTLISIRKVKEELNSIVETLDPDE